MTVDYDYDRCTLMVKAVPLAEAVIVMVTSHGFTVQKSINKPAPAKSAERV